MRAAGGDRLLVIGQSMSFVAEAALQDAQVAESATFTSLVPKFPSNQECVLLEGHCLIQCSATVLNRDGQISGTFTLQFNIPGVLRKCERLFV